MRIAMRDGAKRCVVWWLGLVVLIACAGEDAGDFEAAPRLAAVEPTVAVSAASAESAAVGAAVEPTGAITIEEVVVTGRGCPPGSYHVESPATDGALAIAFDKFGARLRSTDEETSAKYQDRTGCELVIRLKGEEGVSYSAPMVRHALREQREDDTWRELNYDVGWGGEAKPAKYWGLLSLNQKEVEFHALGWSACTGKRELRMALDARLDKTMGSPWTLREEVLAVDRLSFPKLLVRRCGPAPALAPSVAPALPIRSVRTLQPGVSQCPVKVNGVVAPDGTSASIDLSAMKSTLYGISKSSIVSWQCAFEVSVDAPEGQSFTLESSTISGRAELPAGFRASLTRGVTGQDVAKRTELVGPYGGEFTAQDRFRLDVPFVQEAAGKVPCGQRTMTLFVGITLERDRGVSISAGDASLSLMNAGALKFVARPCAPR